MYTRHYFDQCFGCAETVLTLCLTDACSYESCKGAGKAVVS